MRSRIAIGTLVLVVAAVPILTLAVLAKPMMATATAELGASPLDSGGSIHLPVTQLPVVQVAAAAATGQHEPPGRATYGIGGMVTLTLQRTDTHGAIPVT